MAKYLFIITLFSVSLFAADAVQLEQKGAVVKITVTTDGTALLAEYNKAITELEAQRTESLKDKVSFTDGVETARIALTPQQIAFVNAEYDNRIVSYKRMLKLRMLDQATKILQTSMQRASIADNDIAAERAAAKAKIDAEYDKKEALKPTVDVDFDKK